MSLGFKEKWHSESAEPTPFETLNNHRRHALLRSLAVPLAVLFSLSLPAVSFCIDEFDPAALIGKMKEAYAAVRDYRTDVTVCIHRENRPDETKEFVYTFLKPNRIRIDFRKPHAGWILIYPDKNGEVAIYPTGLLGFLDLHLAPDSSFLVDTSGQQINQTDLGLLIRNIGRSLTTERRGPVKLSREAKILDVQVMAEDHFQKGTVTRYTFRIDENLWLPIGVEESMPEGTLKRTVSFRNLNTNIDLPEGFFRPKP